MSEKIRLAIVAVGVWGIVTYTGLQSCIVWGGNGLSLLEPCDPVRDNAESLAIKQQRILGYAQPSLGIWRDLQR